MRTVSGAWQAARAGGSFAVDHLIELFLPKPVTAAVASSEFSANFPVSAVVDADRTALNAGAPGAQPNFKGKGMWKALNPSYTTTAWYAQNFDALVLGDLAGQDSWVRVSGPGTMTVQGTAPRYLGGTGSGAAYRRVMPSRQTEYEVVVDLSALGSTGFVPVTNVDIVMADGADTGADAWVLHITDRGIQVQDASGLSAVISPPVGAVFPGPTNVKQTLRIVVTGLLVSLYVDGVYRFTGRTMKGGADRLIFRDGASNNWTLDNLALSFYTSAPEWLRLKVDGAPVGRFLISTSPSEGGVRQFSLQHASSTGGPWTTVTNLQRVRAWERYNGRSNATFDAATGLITTWPVSTQQLSRPSAIEVVLNANVSDTYWRILVRDAGAVDNLPRACEVELFSRRDLTAQVEEYVTQHTSDVQLGSINAHDLQSFIFRNLDQTIAQSDLLRPDNGSLSVESCPEVVFQVGIDGEFIQIGWFALDTGSQELAPLKMSMQGRARTERAMFERTVAAYLTSADFQRGRMDAMTSWVFSLCNVNEGMVALSPDPTDLPVLDPGRTVREELADLRIASQDRGVFVDAEGVLRDAFRPTRLSSISGRTVAGWFPSWVGTPFFDPSDSRYVWFLRQADMTVATDQVDMLYRWDTRLPLAVTTTGATAPGAFSIWGGVFGLGVGTTAARSFFPSLAARRPANNGFTAMTDEYWFATSDVLRTPSGFGSSDRPELTGYRFNAGIPLSAWVGTPVYVEGDAFAPANFHQDMIWLTPSIVVLVNGQPGAGGTIRVVLWSNLPNRSTATRTVHVLTPPGCTNARAVSAAFVTSGTGSGGTLYWIIAGDFNDGAGQTKVYTQAGILTVTPPAPVLVGTLSSTFQLTRTRMDSPTSKVLWIGGSGAEYGGTAPPVGLIPLSPDAPLHRWDTTQALSTATKTGGGMASLGAFVPVNGVVLGAQRATSTLSTLSSWDGTDGAVPSILTYLPETRVTTPKAWDGYWHGLAVAPEDWGGGRPLLAWRDQGRLGWLLYRNPTSPDATLPASQILTIQEKVSYELGGGAANLDAIDLVVQSPVEVDAQVVYTESANASATERKMVGLSATCNPGTLAPGGYVVRPHARNPIVAGIPPGATLTARIVQRARTVVRAFSPASFTDDPALLKVEPQENPYVFTLGQAYAVALPKLSETKRTLQWLTCDTMLWPEIEVGDRIAISYPDRNLAGTFLTASVSHHWSLGDDGGEARTTLEFVRVV